MDPCGLSPTGLYKACIQHAFSRPSHFSIMPAPDEDCSWALDANGKLQEADEMSFTESATEDHPLSVLHELDTDSVSLDPPLGETHPLPGTSTANTTHNETTTSAPPSTRSLEPVRRPE